MRLALSSSTSTSGGDDLYRGALGGHSLLTRRQRHLPETATDFLTLRALGHSRDQT
jgi:hypothetical protein